MRSVSLRSSKRARAARSHSSPMTRSRERSHTPSREWRTNHLILQRRDELTFAIDATLYESTTASRLRRLRDMCAARARATSVPWYDRFYFARVKL